MSGQVGTSSGLRAAFVRLFAGSIVGKALGFAREIALAATFGTGPAAAAFRAAQTATTLPTHYFSADTLNGGFIPLCARYLREDPARARTLFWSVLLLVSGMGGALSALLFAGADLWTALLVPGLDSSARAMAAGMLRAMAVGVPFYVIASLTSYAEMAGGRYFIASMRAAVQNVGLIAGIGVAAWTGNPLWLGWGFALYAVLFATVGVISVSRTGLARPPEAFDWGEARAVLHEFGRVVRPLLLLPLATGCALAVERIIASFLGTGAVASLDYARTISETGLALLAVPLGMAGLAELSRVGPEALRARVRRLLPAVLLVTVPASLFLALNAEPVVRLLFARGRFGDESVAVTALILVGFSVGFWAQVSGYVLARAMIAEGRSRKVAGVTAVAAGVHIVANVLLYRSLGPIALGLSTSAAGITLLVLTARGLELGLVLRAALLPLAAGSLLYLPIGLALRGTATSSLPLSAAACVLCWIAVVQLAPGLRTVAADLTRTPSLGRAS